MSYTPPEDINFQILTKICSRYHSFVAYRSQNCDKTIIFDFILLKKNQKSPFFRASAKFTERRREKMGTFVFCDLVYHENMVNHGFVHFCY